MDKKLIVFNYCFHCKTMPYLIIKSKENPNEKQCQCGPTSLSFKDYIQNTSNNLYYKYPCTNKLYHLFFYQTEYCIDCLEYLCQWCKNQHNKTCKNHLFLPFPSMSVIHKDSTKEHKYHSLNDMHYCLLRAGEQVCPKCYDCLGYELYDSKDFNECFDFEKKKKEFNEWQENINLLFIELYKEYKEEFDKEEVMKAYQSFKEKYNLIVEIIQILFNT